MRQDMTSPLPPEVAEALDAVDRAVQGEALHWSMAETLREAFIAMSAKLEAAEGEVARLREDARRLDFIAPGFRILAGDHVMQCWWLETLPDGKKVARVASVPVNTPNTVRAVMDAALQEHTP